MSPEDSDDILSDVETSLRRAWKEEGVGFKDADWKALYFDAIAAPCFDRRYSVACTLTKRRDHKPLVARTPAFDAHNGLFAGKEQALDLLAVDGPNLRPVLGAEIEWSANLKHHIPEDDAVLDKLWGNTARHDGYLDEILYDLGRLLAFNPPHMVLATQPSRRAGPDPVVREVGLMYERASKVRAMGKLLLMVDGGKEPALYRFPPA